MKLVYFLDVSEDHVSLSAQCLGKVVSIHLRDVVLDNKAERADVISLRLHHFTHDQRQCPVNKLIPFINKPGIQCMKEANK